jgi:hypothetical protein
MGQFDRFRNNIVGCYRLNGNGDDGSGHDHHASLLQHVVLAQDRYGELDAYRFNGIDSRIEISDGTAFNFASDMTISLWIKPDDTQRPYAALMDKTHYLGKAWILQKSITPGNYFYFGYKELGGAFTNSNGENYKLFCPNNQWTHIAVVKSGSSINYFVNGFFEFTQTTSIDSIEGNGAAPLRFGAVMNNNNNYIRNFGGLMDDVMIFQVPLSQQEITVLSSIRLPRVGPLCFPEPSVDLAPSPHAVPSLISKNHKSFFDTTVGITSIIGGIVGVIGTGVTIFMCFLKLRRAQDHPPYNAPIGITLEEGKEIGLIKLEDSTTYFDYDDNSVLEKTSWVSADDAIIIYDHNDNKIVDCASELVLTSWCPKVSTDFEAMLCRFDSNKDKKFDNKDPEFDKFLIWQDKNQNGISEKNELTSLADAGLNCIDFNTQQIIKNETLRVHGALNIADIYWEDGRITKAYDLVFFYE